MKTKRHLRSKQNRRKQFRLEKLHQRSVILHRPYDQLLPPVRRVLQRVQHSHQPQPSLRLVILLQRHLYAPPLSPRPRAFPFASRVTSDSFRLLLSRCSSSPPRRNCGSRACARIASCLRSTTLAAPTGPPWGRFRARAARGPVARTLHARSRPSRRSPRRERPRCGWE